MPAPLIGLIGKKRVGKDTYAGVLIEHYGYQKVAFAGPLRATAYNLNPIVGTFPLSPEPGVIQTREWRYAEVIDAIGYEAAKDYVPEIRRTLQFLGTSVRDLDEGFWVRGAIEEANKFRESDTPVVITDVRFPNEADAIKAAGGVLLRITRDLPDDGDRHPSEIALDDYKSDWIFKNNRTVSALREDAYCMARFFLPYTVS